MKNWITAFVAGLAAVALVSAASAEVFVYPKQGQSQDAFQKDQYECHNWAKQQTGFDPAAPPQTAAAPPPQQGGGARGAARGAAAGAVVGSASGGDAGKGAAAGAALGGVGGAAKQSANNKAAAQASQQAQAQQQAAYGNYDKAYATCLSGRGYSVK
jgi:outer membrane protein with glycine zipper